MVEIIGSGPSWATFAAAAQATGFADAQGKSVTTGLLGSDGEWFYNAVGAIPEASGVWVRVRFNGETPHLTTLLASWRAAGLTIYEWSQSLGGWSSDGVTLAPSWVAGVGVIA